MEVLYINRINKTYQKLSQNLRNVSLNWCYLYLPNRWIHPMPNFPVIHVMSSPFSPPTFPYSMFHLSNRVSILFSIFSIHFIKFTNMIFFNTSLASLQKWPTRWTTEVPQKCAACKVWLTAFPYFANIVPFAWQFPLS